MTEDIVAKLRALAGGTLLHIAKDHGVPVATTLEAAADEIETLRELLRMRGYQEGTRQWEEWEAAIRQAVTDV